MLCPWQEWKHSRLLGVRVAAARRGCGGGAWGLLGAQRLAELAAWLPEFSGRIKKIQRRLWDLLPVVRNHVYHPKFAGSYSIKNVLPAIVPGMTYDGMEVAHGQDAGLAWESLVRGSLDQSERDRIRRALLEYCGQDTLAMVRLLEKLRHTSHRPNDRTNLCS